MEIVIGEIRIERSADGYWLIENEGRHEGEGMEITGKAALKLETLLREFYDRNF